MVPAASRKDIAVASGNTPMIYLKSILAGVLAVLTAGIFVVGMFALIVTVMGGDWRSDIHFSWKSGVTALLVFALGFAWQFRRASSPPQENRAKKKITSSASTRRG